MASSQEFTRVLHEWAEIFMRRSMHDFIQFNRDSGLSMPQLSALMHVRYGGPIGVSDIANHLGITNAAASQMIERLVQQELLERSEDRRDRRAKKLALTERSRKLLREGIEARRRWMEELTTALDPEAREAIMQSLIMLTQVARDLERPAAAAPLSSSPSLLGDTPDSDLNQ